MQDFLNTVAISDYGPDLLADTAEAQQWARGAVQAWAATRGTEEQAPTLSNMDVAKLRTLRGAVADLLVGRQPAADEIEAKSTFALSADGELRLAPIGRGWLWLASVLWAEILLAQQNRGMAAAQAMSQPGMPVRVLRPLEEQQRRLAQRQDVWECGEPACVTRSAASSAAR